MADRILTKSVLNKLLLAKTQLYFAEEQGRSSSPQRLAIACNLLQDATEAFLLACIELLDGDSQQRTFDKYLEELRALAEWDEVPFKTRLLALNKLRVNSKHFGLTPARDELVDLMPVVREFFSEVSHKLIGAQFFTLSLVDLLPDGESKDILREAHDKFDNGDFHSTLIECRKVIFISIESDYDIAKFSDGKPLGLLSGYSKAPYFSQNPEYIDKNVREPTDFIVFDSHTIELELLRAGIDTVVFWNVRRLTPDVYRRSQSSNWIVKNDPEVLDEEGIHETAEYVLQSTTSILVTLAEKRGNAKYRHSRRFYLDVKHDGIPIYSKASRKSQITSVIPANLRELFCRYSIEGLDDDGHYWYVSHFEDDMSLHGYVYAEDLTTE